MPTKPAETYQQQLDRLKSRGLIVSDEPFALHALAHHNYYRFSAYRFPFTIPGDPDRFQPGTTFDQIWNLYHFDRRLRQLVLEACKRIEISARSRWAYESGHRLGPQAYTQGQHFQNPAIHSQTLRKLEAEMDRANEDFIKHHRITLNMHWPPVWVAVEVASFGNTSNFIGQLKDPSLRQVIASTYQLDEKVFCSVLHHLCVVRNTAAHHSRLWNRKFAVTFQLPKHKPAHLHVNFSTQQAGHGKIYNTLVMMVHLLQCIEPTTHWPNRVLGALQTLDPRLLPGLGAPQGWEKLPIWQIVAAA